MCFLKYAQPTRRKNDNSAEEVSRIPMLPMGCPPVINDAYWKKVVRKVIFPTPEKNEM